jgi:proteasome accessory factor B
VRGATIGEPGDDGWVPVSLPAGPDDALASWVLGFGPDARVVEPPSLRDEVVRRLEAVLAG